MNISEIIRRDSLNDFISYIEKYDYSLNNCIKRSIFETNLFLIKRPNPTLIEYAAFFGSIQIFNKLLMNGATFEPSILLCAIHSQNIELIHMLEEHFVDKKDDFYEKCFYESIKSHHNEIANYFMCNFVQDEKENSHYALVQFFKKYNFAFMQNEFVNKSLFYELCEYDYYTLIYNLLQIVSFDIIILNLIFQLHSKSNISMTF